MLYSQKTATILKFSVNNVTRTVTCQFKKGEEGETEMLKQIDIKVSPCKKSGIHQPIRLKKKMATLKQKIYQICKI